MSPAPLATISPDDQSLNFTTEREPLYVRTSSELLIGINRNEKNVNTLVSDDLVQTSEQIFKVKTPNGFKSNSGKYINEMQNIPNNISWEDMFDTELLSETSDRNLKNSDTLLTKEINYNVENKISKRKNQPKLTAIVPKKVKKVDCKDNKLTKKNNFRKQKFTKTVKNWLNDVDPNNPVECEINYDDCESNAIDKVGKLEITVEKTEAVNKKAIQTQLVNRGGVMKFKKPNSITNDDCKKQTETTKTSDSKLVDKKESTKSKTSTKQKFVPPIKSQTTVKDATYEVKHVDGNCSENIIDNIRIAENNEILIVLVYSNGFCQLNSQYTDDACVPEGLMVHVNNIFYYMKNVENLRETLVEILDTTSIICYDGKVILLYLMSKFSLCLEERNLHIIDTKVGGSLIDPDNSPENFTDLQKLLSFNAEYTIATDDIYQKCAWYTTLLKECYPRLRTLLTEHLTWDLFCDLEMKLLPIITDMEDRGISVDLDRLKSMEDMLLSKMKTVQQQCYAAAGKVFQINSTAQLRTILYDELQLDTKTNIKIRETIAKGAKSTSESMLRSLVAAHPLPKLVLEYRHLHKAHATFLSGIVQHVKNGVVKPTWLQTAAATGRIACNNPNLQAIPKAPFSLVLFPEGRCEGDAEGRQQQVMFRRVYVAREGRSLLGADFRQVECRVFAHAATDRDLLQALQERGDLFMLLAANWLKKPLEAVSGAERERTKRVVYASLYGAGTRKLMDLLDLTYDRALSVLSSFNSTFPSLKKFTAEVTRACVESGGRVRTARGRSRLLPHAAGGAGGGGAGGGGEVAAHAHRQAVNFVVQGTAADLCKCAMVESAARLRKARPPVAARLLLQLHDELVWEVPDEDLHRAAVIIKEVMENCGPACGVSIPLPVIISIGKNWGEMTEYSNFTYV